MTAPSHNLFLSPDASWVRRCAECGLDDLSWRFRSPQDASRYGIWKGARRCRMCGHVGFDLIPLDPLARRQLRPHYMRERHD